MFTTRRGPAPEDPSTHAALERIERLEAAVEALPAQLHAVWAGDLERLRSECFAHVDTVASRLEGAVPGSGTATAAGEGARARPQASTALTDRFYAALEERFRGSRDAIVGRQESYVADVDAVSAKGPVLDLGCGRGEFLRVLRDHGVDALGIDASEEAVAACTADGLVAELGDLRAHLAARPDSSVRVIAMLQVIEHLPFDVLLDVVAEARRVLRPGGLLLLETPNGANVTVAASTFWLDPTHVRPIHPLLLLFVAEQAGFHRLELRGSTPSSPGWELAADDAPGSPLADAVRGLQDMLVGDQDVTLLAHVPD